MVLGFFSVWKPQALGDNKNWTTTVRIPLEQHCLLGFVCYLLLSYLHSKLHEGVSMEEQGRLSLFFCSVFISTILCCKNLSCTNNTQPFVSVFIQESTQYLEECAKEWKSSKDSAVSKLIIMIGMLSLSCILDVQFTYMSLSCLHFICK